MRVSPNSVFSSSLYKAYFGEENSSPSQRAQRSEVNSSAIISQLGDVKAKLLTLAARSKEMTERQRAIYALENAGPSLPPTYTTSEDVSVGISTENANRATRFEKQLAKALSDKTYGNENKRLLSDKKLSGDVKVTLQDGEETKTFSIYVDKETTVKEFVDEFNAKAEGKATAAVEKVIVDGQERYSLKLNGAPGVPVEQLEAIDDDDNSPDPAEADAAQFEKDIRKFAADVNKLVMAVKGDNDGLSSLQSDIGVLESVRDLVKNLKSDDGSVSLASFMSERSSGIFVVNGAAAREAFLNNSEGVVSMLDNLTDEIAGKGGLTQSYAAYGGNLDKVSNVVKVIGQAQTEYRADGLSDKNEEIRLQREQNLQELVNYASRLTSQKVA